MKQIKSMLEKNPDKIPNQSEYLQLAQKVEGGGVQGTGPKKVKLTGIENTVNQDYKTKEDVQGFHLLFEEDGTPKKYFVPTLGKDGKFHYLIMRFRDIEIGQELVMEYKRREGSFKGYIDVRIAGEENKDIALEEAPQGTTEENIPILEE